MIKKEIVKQVSRDAIPEIEEFLEEAMSEADVPFKQITRMNIAVDEMLANVTSYSNASTLKVELEITEETVCVFLDDDGVAYNPLQKENPDVALSLDDREEGGLGIFMTRKLMDDIQYEYKDGHNCLTMILKK